MSKKIEKITWMQHADQDPVFVLGIVLRTNKNFLTVSFSYDGGADSLISIPIGRIIDRQVEPVWNIEHICWIDDSHQSSRMCVAGVLVYEDTVMVKISATKSSRGFIDIVSVYKSKIIERMYCGRVS